MAEFKISKPALLAFGQAGKPFLSFDQFNNVVQVYRDEFYAAQRVPGFLTDVGTKYNLWTVNSENRYLRNLFFDEVDGGVSISIEIPNIEKKSSFPFIIKIFDDNGTYFEQAQNIAVEANRGDGFKVTSWTKVPAIREFVLTEAGYPELDSLFIGIPMVI